MTSLIFIIILSLSIIMPVSIYFYGEKSREKFKKCLAFNVLSFFSLLIIGTIFMFTNTVSAADPSTSINGLGLIAAAIPTAGSAIGAGIATGQAASAALGALSEDPKMFGKALIFVAMSEGVALYGLLISFFIITKL